MSLKASSSIADKNIEKSVGASTHPCLTPFVNNNNNNNNNCLKSNIQCIEIRVQWTVHIITNSKCIGDLPSIPDVHHHSGMQTFYHACKLFRASIFPQ